MVGTRTAKELIDDACELFDYVVYSEGHISFSYWLDILSRVTLGERQFDIDEFWTMALSAWNRKTKDMDRKTINLYSEVVYDRG